MENEDIFVYAYWAFTALCAISIIGTTFLSGLSEKHQKTLLYWRRFKLISASFGIISLLLLVLSFEQLVRGALQAGSKAWADDRFLELKLETGFQKAVACARDDKKSADACGLWTNIDNGLHADAIRSGRKLSKISDWQRGESISTETQTKLNGLIDSLNGSARTASSRSYFGTEARIRIAALASIFLIFSIAGSVGEAAYQYRQAKIASSQDAKAIV